MDRNKRILVRIAASVIAVSTTFGLAACGGNSSTAQQKDSKQIRVSWWGGDSENKGLNAVFDAFKAQEGITTLRESQDFGGYWDKLSTQTAAHNAPDLEMQAGSQIPSYSSKGALVDLNTFKDLDLSQMDEGAKVFGAVGNKLYGVTAATNAYGLIANTKLLKQTGQTLPSGEWTWEQLADIAQAIHDKSGGKLWGLSDSSGDFSLFVLWVRDRGKELYADDGKLNATKEDISSWWKYWDDMRKSGAVAPADVTAEFQGQLGNNPIAKGTGALAFGWTQDFVGYQKLTKDDLSMNLPPYSTENPSLWVNAASMWSISSTSKSQDAAVKAINFFMNDDEAIKKLGTSLGIPPTQKARDVVKKTATGVDKKAINYMDSVNKVSKPLNRLWPGAFPQSRTKFAENAEAYGFGKMTLDQAVSDFMQDAESAANE